MFSYIRGEDRQPLYLVALNVGKGLSTDDFSVSVNGQRYSRGRVVLNSGDIQTSLEVGNEVILSDVTLSPGDAIVVRLIENVKGEL